jgi:hypothetical protein
VEADRDAERGRQVDADHDPEVGPADELIPQERDRRDDGDERDDYGGDVGIALETGHGT